VRPSCELAAEPIVEDIDGVTQRIIDMRPIVKIAGALLGAFGVSTLGLAGVAYATPTSSGSSASTSSATATQSGSSSNTQTARAHFMRDLKNDGFTDIKIMPESYMVRAKDKQGRPVMMVINPDSFTEVVGPATAAGQSSAKTENQKTSGTPQQ
jgi:hypothetical protein